MVSDHEEEHFNNGNNSDDKCEQHYLLEDKLSTEEVSHIPIGALKCWAL